MISVDTNILLYGANKRCTEYRKARSYLEDLAERSDVVICELVLVELYLLLRNPQIISKALSGQRAAAFCQRFRTHPHWRLVDSAPVMHEVWRHAAEPSFARRRIIDARLALSLRHHGVTELATRNVKDFEGFGFRRVFSPVG